MKTHLSTFSPTLSVLQSSFRVLAILLSIWLLNPGESYAVPITGANGTTVDFAGVKTATPEGLEVKILSDGNLATVPWDKFDMARMETEQPSLFAAYEKTKNGETVDLYLGVFEGQKPEPKMEEEKKVEAKPKNFARTTVKGKPGSGFTSITVSMRRPSANAKAIFLGAFGEGRAGNAFSSIYLAETPRTSWDTFFTNNSLVPVGFRVQTKGDVRKEPFFLADKGSGEAVLGAISKLAKELGRNDLAEAPVVIYGRDVLGSAFAYNLAQFRPERIACAVASKGTAFFSVEPTEESVKVPLLVIKGQYDDGYKEWELEPEIDEQGARVVPPHEGQNRFVSTLPMRPNWTLAIQERGTGDIGPLTEMLGREFISAVIKQRFGGGTYAEMVPDIAYLGNMKSKSIKNMPDDLEALEVDETWLPDSAFGKIWKQFIDGSLEPGTPRQ